MVHLQYEINSKDGVELGLSVIDSFFKFFIPESERISVDIIDSNGGVYFFESVDQVKEVFKKQGSVNLYYQCSEEEYIKAFNAQKNSF